MIKNSFLPHSFAHLFQAPVSAVKSFLDNLLNEVLSLDKLASKWFEKMPYNECNPYWYYL